MFILVWVDAGLTDCCTMLYRVCGSASFSEGADFRYLELKFNIMDITEAW